MEDKENKENKADEIQGVQDEQSSQQDIEPTASKETLEEEVKEEIKSEGSTVKPSQEGKSFKDSGSSESDFEEEELTGIEEESEEQIVQKVKRGGKKSKKKKSDRRVDNGKEGQEWVEKVVQIRRVTKVVKGGKKLSFRAVVIAGNAKGQVGVGVGKAAEVISAIQKGVADAKKTSINVQLLNNTIPHVVVGRAGAAKVLLKPAIEGTGIIAGGAARTVLELGGVGDVLSKSLGSRSPLNVARATLNGLTQLRKFDQIAKLREMSLTEMLGIPKKEKLEVGN